PGPVERRHHIPAVLRPDQLVPRPDRRLDDQGRSLTITDLRTASAAAPTRRRCRLNTQGGVGVARSTRRTWTTPTRGTRTIAGETDELCPGRTETRYTPDWR